MFSKLLKSVDPIYGNPQASHSATCDVIAGKYCEMFMFTLRFVSLCCFSSRSTVEFSYLSSSLSLSQCQWVAVRSAAVTITFLVVAKRSIGCRRTQLCVSSGFYAYLELTGPLLRPVSCVPTISRRTVLSTQQFRAFTRVVDWSQMLFRLCFTSRRCHKTDVVGRDMLTLTGSMRFVLRLLFSATLALCLVNIRLDLNHKSDDHLWFLSFWDIIREGDKSNTAVNTAARWLIFCYCNGKWNCIQYALFSLLQPRLMFL